MFLRRADLTAMLRDTLRESARSWRLPAALALGLGFGAVEHRATGDALGFAFGPIAALYTLFLGPLPWRALVPLEADGQRAQKFGRALVAAAIAFGLFLCLATPYVAVSRAFATRGVYLLGAPREFALATLLFMIGGWGLARDVQLEQRLDRTLRNHGELAAELEAARLYALRADLDPHFLFNALNAIASQCASDPTAAEDNIVRLSSLLRAVLDTRRQPLHALEDEVALARDYLGLLAARYPALRHRIDTSAAPPGFLVPPLLLQPLLENAVRHGAIDAGEISVAARTTGDTVTLEVRSPGAFGGARAGGMGLELVRRRAELAWGAATSFTVATVDAATTVATIVAPLTHAPASRRSAA
jgi:two-component system sensor histidine kinase AlgZ